MEPIVVHFTLTDEDYLRAFRLFNNRKVNYYVKQTITFLIIFAVVSFILVRDRHFGQPYSWLPFPLMVLAFLAYLNMENQQPKQRIKKNEQLTLPGSLELDEQEIVLKNELTKTSYSWRNFREVYENTEYFYLVTTHDPKNYLFTPKRFFGSEREIEAFRTFAQQHIRPLPSRK